MPDSLLLMDTDIVSRMGRRKPPPGLRPWLLEVGVHRLGICFPTLTELQRGAHLKREAPDQAIAIRAWIAELLDTGFPMLEMSPEVAEIYADMTSTPSLRHMWTVQKGQKKNRLGHDLMIAAVSIAHQTPVLTANLADFERINELFPLPGVYQPMQGRWHVPPPAEISLPRFDSTAPDRYGDVLPMLGEAMAPKALFE